jgi:hypothetical protein
LPRKSHAAVITQEANTIRPKFATICKSNH